MKASPQRRRLVGVSSAKLENESAGSSVWSRSKEGERRGGEGGRKRSRVSLSLSLCVCVCVCVFAFYACFCVAFVCERLARARAPKVIHTHIGEDVR